jgi:hypothetical protein
MHPGEGVGGDHVLQHLDRIVLDDAQVAQALFADALEQGPHAGRVDLDAQEIGVTARRGNLRGGMPHAETDLDDQRRVAAEQADRIQRLGGIGHQVSGPQLLQGTLLPGAHAPGPQHEAADAAVGRTVRLAALRGQVIVGGSSSGSAVSSVMVAAVNKAGILPDAPSSFSRPTPPSRSRR